VSEIARSGSSQDRSPVLKALRLLAHLAASKEPVALAELSRALKLPKPTAYRLARSIESAGFVHKDPLTRRYRVGAAFEDLALSALRYGAGHARRELLMNGLAERLGARVNLVVLKAGNVDFVEWVESTAPLRVDIRGSAPIAVHCSASGKLLLAFGSDDVREHVLRSAPFAAFTKKTITSRRALARELDKIRERGFAEDDQELLPGVNCLAVPIHNLAGEVVAGLAVMAPVASLPLEILRGHLQDIRACAAAISAELSSRPGTAAAPKNAASAAGRASVAEAGIASAKHARVIRKGSRLRHIRAAANVRRPAV
jgi:IclR family transcriptional regulator, acetate operon repressor